MKTLSRFPLPLLLFTLLLAACGGREEPEPVVERQVVYRTPDTAAIAGEIGVDADVNAYGILVYAEGTSHVAMTDEQGRFEISGLPEGTFRLRTQRFDLEPYDYGHISVNQADLSKSQPFMTLPRALMASAETPAAAAGFPPLASGDPGNIRGSVITRVPGDQAGVSVTIDRTSFSTRTDANGQFELSAIPPGSYSIVFNRSGYQSRTVSAQVLPASNTLLQDIRLEPAELAPDATRTVFGRVDMLLADGSLPTDFSGVRVNLEGTGYSATPDSQGRFEIRNIPPGRYAVSASASGFLLERRFNVDLENVTAAEVDLLLVEDDDSALRGTLYGTVIREGDESATHAGTNIALAGSSYTAVTDEFGDFIIFDIEPGRYQVLVSHSGYKSKSIPGIDLDEGDEVDLGTLRLERDIEAPRVVMTIPSDGTRNFTINDPTRVLVQFSMNMATRSVVEAISISPEVGFRVAPEGASGRGTDTFAIELAGVAREGRTMLRYDTQYTVTVAKSAESIEGVPMEDDHTFRFRTGRPEIIATAPADRDRDVWFDYLNPVRVYFNAPIDPRTIDARDVEFRPSLPSNPNIRFSTDSQTGWTVMTVDAVGNPDVEYRVRVRGNARTVGGARVGNMPYSFSFRTAPLRHFESGDQRLEDQRRARDLERERSSRR